MTGIDENMHAWNHFVLFLMLFMITLAVLRMGGPTGLASSNQTMSAAGLTDLKPFLTAVGLLVGLFIAIVFAMNANFEWLHRPQLFTAKPQAVPEVSIQAINRELARIRRRLGRFR